MPVRRGGGAAVDLALAELVEEAAAEDANPFDNGGCSVVGRTFKPAGSLNGSRRLLTGVGITVDACEACGVFSAAAGI